MLGILGIYNWYCWYNWYLYRLCIAAMVYINWYYLWQK